MLDAPNLGIPVDCNNSISGIVFDSVSGSITGSTVLHMFQATSSGYCYNFGIKIRNTAGLPISVTVSGNRVLLSGTFAAFSANDSGITVNVSGNEFRLGISNQGSTVELLNGSGGSISGNTIETGPILTTLGCCPGTGIDLYKTTPGTKVKSNNINLISDLAHYGIIVQADNAVITGNRVFNYGANGSPGDTGIWNAGATNPASNSITNNEVRCYQTPFVNAGGSNGNVVLPCPWP